MTTQVNFVYAEIVESRPISSTLKVCAIADSNEYYDFLKSLESQYQIHIDDINLPPTISPAVLTVEVGKCNQAFGKINVITEGKKVIMNKAAKAAGDYLSLESTLGEFSVKYNEMSRKCNQTKEELKIEMVNSGEYRSKSDMDELREMFLQLTVQNERLNRQYIQSEERNERLNRQYIQSEERNERLNDRVDKLENDLRTFKDVIRLFQFISIFRRSIMTKVSELLNVEKSFTDWNVMMEVLKKREEDYEIINQAIVLLNFPLHHWKKLRILSTDINNLKHNSIDMNESLLLVKNKKLTGEYWELNECFESLIIWISDNAPDSIVASD